MNAMDATNLVSERRAAKTEAYCHTCGSRLQSTGAASRGLTTCPECGVFSRLLRAMGRGDLPFLLADAVLPDLKVEHKTGAIFQMVENLAACGGLAEAHVEEVAATLIRREAASSTGIGGGIAIPHAKHPAVAREVGTIARCRHGIEFDSIDGEPVYSLILLLSPVDHHAEHVQALAKVARILRTVG